MPVPELGSFRNKYVNTLKQNSVGDMPYLTHNAVVSRHFYGISLSGSWRIDCNPNRRVG